MGAFLGAHGVGVDTFGVRPHYSSSIEEKGWDTDAVVGTGPSFDHVCGHIAVELIGMESMLSAALVA